MKVDNVPLARPHYGITQADLVFEILVEGLATRLAAVFHSQDPQTIGNIRSARGEAVIVESGASQTGTVTFRLTG